MLAAKFALLLIASGPTPKANTEDAERPEVAPALESAEHYAEAKRLLARGRAAESLKALAKKKNSLIPDREALLRGDALLALGQREQAREAYLFAHEHGELKIVRGRATRGLINVAKLTKRYEEHLRFIDVLLADKSVRQRPSLLLERATLLERAGQRKAAAEAAFRLQVDYPASKVAREAEVLLDRLAKKGVSPPVTSARVALVRAKNLFRDGAWEQAEDALSALAEKHPELELDVELARAELLQKRGKRSEELEVLQRLYRTGLDAKSGPDVLDRLARLSMKRDDNELAMKYFDELTERFPESSLAPEAGFFSAWLPYNGGDYGEASRRFLTFAGAHRRWPRRAEALWFAGWAAFLAENGALARRAFDQLREEHPTSEMGVFAHYWMGRIREREKDLPNARLEYREVLKTAPLSYYGHWAERRLAALEEGRTFGPPPTQKPTSMKEALAVLGTDRPRSIDRALSLHAAGVLEEALEELQVAHQKLKKIRDTRGRVMIAEMLDHLGAHHEAFLLAMGITKDGSELARGEPYAWRAWRLAYPKAFWKDVEASSKVHDIDPLLVLSIMRTESHFRPYVTSRAGARGLMQIMPNTARMIGRAADGGAAHAARFRQPESNIWLGAWYLKQLLQRYDGQLALAIGAYNAGPRAMDRWVAERSDLDLDVFVETVSYRETRRYIRRVLETYSVYKRLEGSGIVEFETVRAVKPTEGAVSF